MREIIRDFLAIRGLELSPEKTVITHIDDGFDFLGWNFRKYKGKLLIKPSQKSIKSITQKLKTIVSKAKSWTQDELIKTLNPVIRGWANYHRHIVAKDTFKNLIPIYGKSLGNGENGDILIKVINGLQTNIGLLKVPETGYFRPKRPNFSNSQMPKSADIHCLNLMPTPTLTGTIS